MAFVRTVSANESLYHKAARAFSSIVIQVVIEGKGRVGQGELQAAVDKVSLSFPGCRLRMHGNEWRDDGTAPKVILFPAYPDFRGDLNQAIHSHGAFDPSVGLTSEVGLALDGEKCLLVFRTLHAVMDGQGLQSWAKAVFQALRQETIPSARGAISDDELIKMLSAPVRVDEPKLPGCVGPRARPHTKVDYDGFEYARQTIAGSTAGLIAKLAISARDYLNGKSEGDALVMVPVDVRDDVPPEYAELNTGNLSLPIFLKVEAKSSWMDVASQLLRKIETKSYLGKGPSDYAYRLAPSRILSWVLSRFHRYQIDRGRYLVSAIISHVGKQSLKDFSCQGFEADSMVFLPSPMPICPFSIIITEYAGSVEICLGKSRALPMQPAEVLKALLDQSGLKQKDVAPDANSLSPLRGPLNPVERPLDIMLEIEQSVEVNAHKVALIDGQRETSFQEYKDQRNRIAKAMTAKAGRTLTGERIVVILNRSTETLVVIHACLYLGAIFVPVDPLNAEERVAMILEDSQPLLIITETHDGERNGVTAMSLGSLTMLASRQSPELLAVEYRPEMPAYIIFTSGTTGRPKGATITRNNLGHYMDSARKAHLSAYPHRALAFFTSLSFDISITPLFGSLLIGCPLVIIRENSPLAAMEQLLKSPDVTYAMMTPAHLQILLSLGIKPVSRWLTLAVGGEGWTWELACQAKALFGDSVTIFNVYGPTEVTVVMAIYPLDFTRPETSGLPIATTPVDHTSIYILDENQQECMEGEMYIGGHAVAQGYWRDPIKSAAAFLPDPFRPGYTMYKSGDQAVFREGKLYCTGRIDDQVKINGYRVELDEITSVLKSCDGIQDAIVLLEKIHLRPALHAFYTSSAHLADEMLKDRLRQALPHFMIPSTFLRVSIMPLTVNGKIDRTTLLTMIPSYEKSGGDPEIFDVRQIWAQFLALPYDQLHLKSNYFELGGDSATLLRILHEIDSRKFQGKASALLIAQTKEFWAVPTLRQMMRMVENVAASG